MTSPSPNPYALLLAYARQVVTADDAQELDQKLIDLLRAACSACETQSTPLERHTSIPTSDGLYWYHQHDGTIEPVLIQQARYAGRFKAFNGREQTWTREGEFFVGPVLPPRIN
jgi:hypothetical protein